MFRFKCSSLAAMAAMSTLCGTPAGASSILIDQGSATYDPATHLQWLDISATRGLSYNGVSTQTDYLQTGWRFATDVEVNRLYTDAGVPVVSRPDNTFFYGSDASQPSYAAVEHDAFVLGSELGWVAPPSDDYLTAAVFDVKGNPSALGFTTLSILGYLQNGPGSSLNINETIDTIDKDQAIRIAGALLVRDVSAVPIPGEAIPLGTLLLGLTGFSWWRRKQQGVNQA